MSAEPVEDTRLYHSPLGLFPFQVDGVARTYWQWTESDLPVILSLWDTGIGKSHLAMATSAFLFEDDLVDHVIIVAEANKVLDWVQDDFPKFTGLSVSKYTGATEPARRKKYLADMSQVTVMSYETGRNDICTFRPKSSAVTGDKMLTEALVGKRVALIFDEFSRLRSRTSKTYIAWDYLLNRRMRRVGPEPKVLGLTATTVEASPADHWNAGRLIAPSLAGTVADFEANHVATRSVYDNSPATWKNLTRDDPYRDPNVIPLNERFLSITMRKRKTDPDVIDYFPAKMENPPTMITLGAEHRALYNGVEEIFADESLSDEVSRQGFNLLRRIANHPLGLIHSTGQYARDIVAQVGTDFLRQVGSAKVEAMLEWQARMAQQQTVIFTFYGGSVLPLLEQALREQGYAVSTNHGKMGQDERKRSQDAYKAGDTQVFLSSDAGAKGLNLGVGSGLLHYENPLLWSTFDQRSNRIHRIDSKHASVTIDSLVARDTVEVGATMKMLTRNQWAEAVQDADYVEEFEPTERFLRAADRIAMMRRAA